MNWTVAELIARCRAAGLALLVEGDSLHVDFASDPPVDLIENPANGFIYVAELGANRITLLRPTTPGPQLTPSGSPADRS